MRTPVHHLIHLPIHGSLPLKIGEYIAMSEISKMKEFCQPLNHLGIDFFLYSQRCNDRDYLHLTNCPEWLKMFFEERLYLHCTFHQPTMSYDMGNVLWENVSSQYMLYEHIQQNFNINNVLTRIQPYEHCQEFFSFGAKQGSQNVMNIYINHFDLLQRFILSFKDKYYDSIEKEFNKRVVIPCQMLQNDMTKKKSTETLESFYHLANLQRYYIGHQCIKAYLTRREIECLQWYIEGKTTCEIGIILGLSRRTVETHIQRIKEKTSCYSRSQLSANFAFLLSSKINDAIRQPHDGAHINNDLLKIAA
jgi:DNA-binding CsgD family transcriptional regulator